MVTSAWGGGYVVPLSRSTPPNVAQARTGPGRAGAVLQVCFDVLCIQVCLANSSTCSENGALAFTMFSLSRHVRGLQQAAVAGSRSAGRHQTMWRCVSPLSYLHSANASGQRVGPKALSRKFCSPCVSLDADRDFEYVSTSFESQH